MIPFLALVAQLSVVARAPQSASTCEAVEVTVAIAAPAGAVPRLSVPAFAPFEVLRASTVPHVTRDASGGSIAEYSYVIATDRVGNYTIPSFQVANGNDVARSRPIDISVHSGDRGDVATVVARARIDTGLGLNFRALSRPETVFVGQQANYEVAVFLNATVRERLRRNPTFFPPDMQSMLAYDLPSRTDAPRQLSSRCFDALVYQRALFPLMAGRFSVPPAQLVYALPLSANFFSREETHELQTDSTVVIAIEPPEQGRPSDYSGAVGNLHVAARLDTNVSRVGDPLVLTVRVSGSGNVKLFPRPTVGVTWATLVKGDERVHVDTTARRIAGTKEFDWVLTPRIAGELDLPPIRYPYFDPDARRYEVATTDAAHVRIGAGSLASADTARSEMLLSVRTRYRGAVGRPLHERPVFWALFALLPLPALTFSSRDRRRRNVARTPSAATRLTILAKSRGGEQDAGTLRRAFTAALAERLHLYADSFVHAGSLARALRRRGVSTEVALETERFLRQLDEAAFSELRTLPANAAGEAERLYRLVDGEALGRHRIPAAAFGVVALIALGVATAQAFDGAAAQAAFDRGVSAYQQHNFVAAREDFIAAASAEPAAPDAWANLGTASWAVADTARSVGAWQRALRIEPLAGDVRERTDLVHALPWTAAGYVPPLPSSWVFDVAILLWAGAWGIAAVRASRGGPLFDRSATTIVIASAVVVLGGFALADRLSGRRLAVLRHTESLRSDPALEGERGTTAIVGEVVRVTGRQGAWTRVTLDDGRDGWIENAALFSLDVHDTSQLSG